MDDIPTENSVAGSILAVMVLLAPLTTVFVSAIVKPRLAAFLSALTFAGVILAAGAWLAFDSTPTEGTRNGIMAFGIAGGVLSFGMASVIVGGRTLLAKAAEAKAQSDALANAVKAPD